MECNCLIPYGRTSELPQPILKCIAVFSKWKEAKVILQHFPKQRLQSPFQLTSCEEPHCELQNVAKAP